MVSSPFIPNFVHLYGCRGFDSQGQEIYHTIILTKRVQSQVLHQKLSLQSMVKGLVTCVQDYQLKLQINTGLSYLTVSFGSARLSNVAVQFNRGRFIEHLIVFFYLNLAFLFTTGEEKLIQALGKCTWVSIERMNTTCLR